ncbi:unnamed protein product [Rotaria sp. Silwood1]|nr:unnamed protein product [Rotaria sp. Silwood1]CAF1676671.1 unnamed protein product [Rotaria sp. Silwood1]
MSQHIDLTAYLPLITSKRAKATVICSIGYDAHIIITQYDENKRKLHDSGSIKFRWTELLLPSAASLKLTIEFYNPLSHNHSWCEYVELHIEPDYMVPDTSLLYPWEPI